MTSTDPNLSTDSPPAPDTATPRRRPINGWESVARKARRVLRAISIGCNWIPITWRGLFLLGIMAASYGFIGVPRQDEVIIGLSLSGGALIVLLSLIVLICSLVARLNHCKACVDPLDLHVGTPAITGYRTTKGVLSPLITAEIAWVDPATADVETVLSKTAAHERVTPRRRGYYHRIVRTVRFGDALGLCAVRYSCTQVRTVSIQPASANVQRIPTPPQAMTGDEQPEPSGAPQGDLVDFRRYAAGDPLKWIHWKTYARTGRLVVRTPERSLSSGDRTLAYLVSGDHDEPAAAIVRKAIESGLLGTNFIFGADGASEYATEIPAAIDCIMRSAGNSAVLGASRDPACATESGLGQFLVHGRQQNLRALVLFVPATPGPWLTAVINALSTWEGPCCAILGLDAPPLAVPGRWQKLLFRPSKKTGVTHPQLQQVCTALADANIELHVMNSHSGEEFVGETQEGRA